MAKTAASARSASRYSRARRQIDQRASRLKSAAVSEGAAAIPAKRETRSRRLAVSAGCEPLPKVHSCPTKNCSTISSRKFGKTSVGTAVQSAARRSAVIRNRRAADAEERGRGSFVFIGPILSASAETDKVKSGFDRSDSGGEYAESAGGAAAPNRKGSGAERNQRRRPPRAAVDNPQRESYPLTRGRFGSEAPFAC